MIKTLFNVKPWQVACIALLLLQLDAMCGQVLTWREAIAKQQAAAADIRNEGRDSVDLRARRERKLAAKRVAAIQHRNKARTAQDERTRQRDFDRTFSMNAANNDVGSADLDAAFKSYSQRQRRNTTGD